MNIFKRLGNLWNLSSFEPKEPEVLDALFNLGEPKVTLKRTIKKAQIIKRKRDVAGEFLKK